MRFKNKKESDIGFRLKISILANGEAPLQIS